MNNPIQNVSIFESGDPIEGKASHRGHRGHRGGVGFGGLAEIVILPFDKAVEEGESR